MARWTRDSAIEYLASHPAFTPAKPLEDYTTAYLKRTASAFQTAEEAGKAAPTTAERRGHGRAPVEHIEANPEKHLLDQYRVLTPAERDLDKADLTNLYRRAARGKSLDREVMVVITGVGQASPRFKEKYKKDEIHTYSYSMNLRSLKGFIGDMSSIDPEAIFQFAEDISFLQWEEILSISFAFPNE